MKLEIKEVTGADKYKFQLYINGSARGIYISAEAALEAGSKRLLEFLPKETFDFGSGPVSAHQHPNGGGWVADTAHVDDTVFVGPNAEVHGNAKVYNSARVLDNAKVYGRALIYGNVVIKNHAKVYGTTIIEGSVQICNDIVFSSIKISGEGRITRNV